MNHHDPTTSSSPGRDDLRTRVEARKHDLEAAVATLAASDRSRQNLESVLSQVEGLLTGDLSRIPHVVAAQLSVWLEASKHLDEHHPGEAGVRRGFVANLGRVAADNAAFRRVIYTGASCQLVVMTLRPAEGLGAEVHEVDQFFRVEEGAGDAVVDGVRTPIGPGSAVLVPAGTKHDIVNTGRGPLRLSTIYAPPQHRDQVVHHTRADAERDDEQFDGATTEAPAISVVS